MWSQRALLARKFWSCSGSVIPERKDDSDWGIVPTSFLSYLKGWNVGQSPHCKSVGDPPRATANPDILQPIPNKNPLKFSPMPPITTWMVGFIPVQTMGLHASATNLFEKAGQDLARQPAHQDPVNSQVQQILASRDTLIARKLLQVADENARHLLDVLA